MEWYNDLMKKGLDPYEKIKFTPANKKSYDGSRVSDFVNDEVGQSKWGRYSKGKVFKIGKLFYLYRSVEFMWFRFFSKYGLHVRDTSKTRTYFSERNGYKKFLDIGKYRFSILK